MTSGHGGRLETAVVEAFGPLLVEFGFTRVSGSELAPEAWVTLHNDTTALTVHEEIGSAPWLKISRLNNHAGKTGEGEGYSLSQILSLRAPSHERPKRGVTGASLREVLAEQARLLRQYGTHILRGDFNEFPKLREIAERSESARGPAAP